MDRMMPTMSIDMANPVGVKVVYTGKNGMNSDHEYAVQNGLKVGQTYTVQALTVHSWSTDVYLQETQHCRNRLNQPVCFNSVLFLEEELYQEEMAKS